MDCVPTIGSKPLALLVCAMGGEGGGVLTGWIVAAAQSAGFAAQATSVPGVAQRTGGTTYYVEIAQRDAAGRTPVFALTPVAGEVDVVIASELLEAARAARLGYVTPERTRLIASTHRVFLIQEKMAMGDGRIAPEDLEAAARSRARTADFLDMNIIARDTGAPISAVMLGSLAGASALPIDRHHFETAIRESGIAVDRNLKAFAAAFAAIGKSPAPVAPKVVPDDFIISANAEVSSGEQARYPAAAHAVIANADERLTDYQDADYAALYHRRLEPFRAQDAVLCREVARHLALRMSYEDVIRVAQLKARAARMDRIRSELGAAGEDPFEVRDFFKPGVNEIADILPPRLARWLLRRAKANPRIGSLHIGMRLRTTTITGYVRIWLLARMRNRRRHTYRYEIEQQAIDRWLSLIQRALDKRDTALAREIAELARLIKGYGETHARGTANYDRIVKSLVEPALAEPGGMSSAAAAAHVKSAREAALADPEGNALENLLARTPVPATTATA